jgi:outer membrane protein assembly factor BamD
MWKAVFTTGFALAVATLTLSGCGSSDDDSNYVEQPVEVLYNRALDDLGTQDYKAAAKGFEEVDRQHPYSVWATKAQIMAAFAYYQSNKYDEAVIALDRFIQLHPGHRDIPYAYYLKALCFYEQISDVGRDQRMTQQALDALAEVVKRFPNRPMPATHASRSSSPSTILPARRWRSAATTRATSNMSAPSTAIAW